MSALIDGLLILSRIARATMHLDWIDLGAEVAQIAADLQGGTPGRRVHFAIERPVQARADRLLVRTVLQNLMQNAWKFTSGQDDALIEFGTAPAGDAAVCCYVRDDGPASTRTTPASCSSHSTGCTRSAISPVPGSAWPASSRLWTGTGDGPGPKARSAKARLLHPGCGGNRMTARTILLVEDNPDDEALTLRALKKNKYRSTRSYRGPRRRRGPGSDLYSRASSGEPLPGLILLTLNCPRLMGWR